MSDLGALSIRPLQQEDIAPMAAAFVAMGWPDRTATLQRYLSQQQADDRPMFVAFLGAEFAGYLTVTWHSTYEHFAEAGIPEIQDLNVITRFRRRGVASALVEAAEKLICTRSRVVGIGVGMYADYGPAQRMYVSRGYVPNGRGLAWRGKTVSYGDQPTVDDDLALYFTRHFAAPEATNS